MAITHSRFYRPPFNPAQDFVVARRMPFGKKTLEPGADFPKEACPLRRLRQLYNLRRIDFKDANYQAKPKVVTIGPTLIAPDYMKMNVEELRAWLKANGYNPRFGATQDSLIEAVKKVLNVPVPKKPPAAVAKHDGPWDVPRGLPAEEAAGA